MAARLEKKSCSVMKIKPAAATTGRGA